MLYDCKETRDQKTQNLTLPFKSISGDDETTNRSLQLPSTDRPNPQSSNPYLDNGKCFRCITVSVPIHLWFSKIIKVFVSIL